MLLHVVGEVDCDNGIFEKFHMISMASVLYLFSIELALSMIMLITMLALALNGVVFNFASPLIGMIFEKTEYHVKPGRQPV